MRQVRPILRGGGQSLGRRLTGILVAYAVAAQSLLIVLGGFAMPAFAADRAPGFEICLHDGQGGADTPASVPANSGCTHCIFCFAGSHHAVVATPAVAVLHLTYADPIDSLRGFDVAPQSRAPPHSNASPRGPPLAG